MTPRRVTAADEWAGAQLRARRVQAELTQAEVAERSQIDRSRYNALETGRHTITLTYAERIAPVLGVRKPAELLPPPQEADADIGGLEMSPLDLLQQLAATVDDLLGTVERLESEIADLRRVPVKRRRATGGR